MIRHNQKHMGRNTVFAVERQQHIARRVKERGRVGVADLAREFETSPETIRRDLAILEENGGLRRVHGGAVDLARASAPEPAMAVRGSLRVEEKRRIVQAALAHLPPHGSVLLEGSSTSLMLAEALPDGLPLTVVTNGIPIAHHLASRDFNVLMIGGRVRNRSLSTLDDWVHPGLDGLHADVAFLGTLSFSGETGLTTPDTADAIVKSRCLRVAEKNVLLAESAKFGAVSLCRYGSLTELDLIITDAGMSERCADEIRAAGVEVIIA